MFPEKCLKTTHICLLGSPDTLRMPSVLPAVDRNKSSSAAKAAHIGCKSSIVSLLRNTNAFEALPGGDASAFLAMTAAMTTQKSIFARKIVCCVMKREPFPGVRIFFARSLNFHARRTLFVAAT
jgi:hypothetical protein